MEEYELVTTAKLSFCVAATGPDLRLSVTLNDALIWNGCPGPEPVEVTHQFDDSQDQSYTLIFEMQGKQPEHTQISATGEILQDRCITVSDFAFDDIQLGHTMTEISQYHHDTNGTTDAVIDTFHSVMGCNGRVEIKFSTPVYLWLLENM